MTVDCRPGPGPVTPENFMRLKLRRLDEGEMDGSSKK